MKKIMSILLAFCLSLAVLANMPVQAAASSTLEISPGGTIQKVTYTKNNDSEEIRIYSSNTEIVRHYVLSPEGSVKNYRLVFEILDAYVPQTIKFDVNNGSVVQIRMANLSDPRRTNVVVETTKKPVYTIGPSSDRKSVVLVLNGSSSGTGTPSSTATPTPKPSASATPAPSPSATPKPSSSASATPKPSQTVPASSSPAAPGGSGDKTVVITKNGPLSWSMTGDTCRVELSGISLVQAQDGNIPRYEIRDKEKLIQITIPGKVNGITDGFLTGNSIIYGALINYNSKQNNTVIRIPYNDTISLTHSVSGGSSVFLLKKGTAQVPATSPVPSSTPVATPKPSSSATPTPSPSKSPTSSATPSTSPKTSGDIRNVKTGTGDGKTALKIVGSGIVGKFNAYKDKITVDNSLKDSVTFIIPAAVADLGNGTLLVNDSLIKTVTTITTSKNTYLTIEKSNPNSEFDITAGSGPDELYVSVSSAITSSKIVVIDPGHGGSDPGAVINGYNEKKYNLDIALRVEAILKSQGVNVHMTRRTDVYVSLNDRVKFANNLNAALFVSIHNNSMPNGYKGSMVLYHHTSYKGKAYATTMLENLVKDLKTGNLGLSARQNTVVLRDTKMPAILAEVACMSDPDDLARLNTDDFIQKAAESIARSIIQILKSME